MWGPLSILTYWSLKEYDHLPVVRSARQAMVRQLSAMAANVWTGELHLDHSGQPSVLLSQH